MIGGTGMSLVCTRNRSRMRLTEYLRRQAVLEDGCSHWKWTPADGSKTICRNLQWWGWAQTITTRHQQHELALKQTRHWSINDALIDAWPSFNQTQFQLLQYFPYPVIHRIKAGTVRRPQVWRYEVGVHVLQQLNGFTRMAGCSTVLLERVNVVSNVVDGWQ